jgi:hypothetical protein
MRQKTINLRNQGSSDKKIDFFSQTLSHIPRWARLEQKTRAKNSHAWAPLSTIKLRLLTIFIDLKTCCKKGGPESKKHIMQNHFLFRKVFKRRDEFSMEVAEKISRDLAKIAFPFYLLFIVLYVLEALLC